MNKDYQKVLDKMLENISKKKKTPKLLLHVCCAPCSSYVLEYLTSYFEITLYFYNPNDDIELIDETKSSPKILYSKNATTKIETYCAITTTYPNLFSSVCPAVLIVTET